MNRSLEGPARSLLSSFTVATTPPPRSTKDDMSKADNAPQVRQVDKEAKKWSTPTSLADAFSTTAAEEQVWAVEESEEAEQDEDEPRPSFIAPQPAPAPSSSTAQSSDIFTAAAATAIALVPPPQSGRHLPSGWHSGRRPSVRYANTTTSLHTIDNTAAPATAIQGSPFTRRTANAETSANSSSRKASRSFSAAAEGGELRRQTSEIGGLTPKIRYRSASSSGVAPRASASLWTSSQFSDIWRMSSEQPCSAAAFITTTPHITLGINGRRSASLDTAKSGRDAVGNFPAGTSDVSADWLSPREHAAPVLAPMSSTPSWMTLSSILKPFGMNAAADGCDNGRVSTLRPPPLLTRTLPGTPEGVSSFTSGSLTKVLHSEATSTTLASLHVQRHTRLVQSQSQPMGNRNTRRDGVPRGTPRTSNTVVWTAPPSDRLADVGPAAATVEDAKESSSEREISEAEDATRVGLPFNVVPIAAAAAATVDKETTAEESLSRRYLTLRSLTEEYNQFSAEGTVGWVGLQVHLRRHTQSTQITSLDLTCYRMRREQWTWFTLDILPQLRSLEVLRLVQMGLTDDEVVELVRGSCGWRSYCDGVRSSLSAKRASPQPASLPTSHSGSVCPRNGSNSCGGVSTAASGGTGAQSAHTSPLPFLRVLDLSGNVISQRSCNHLGKMLLWMADTLEEVRLLGNPLKDYGMQTLAIYLSKLNVGTLKEDPELFPGSLRHQLRLAERQQQQYHHDDKESERKSTNQIQTLPIGVVLLDLRDCRASARGLSDILAAASRAHRLHTVILSHNVAGVTALLPLPSTAYRVALDVADEEMAAAAPPTDVSGHVPHTSTYCLGPAPCRLRLAKTPLISSGALLRRQRVAFSDVRGFANSCVLSTLVFHSVPLSQTCSPVGCRELLLNIFFSCPQLDLMDLSDTFELSLVPTVERMRLVAEANREDALEQRLRGPEVQRGLQMYREDQGEVEFLLNSATVAGQTRLGDIFGELMAHAAHNAVVRRRLVPAAFAHVRELNLSNTGLTDAGVRGFCVSVRRGRTRTGMLANLAVLNLSDNLLTVRGCLRVISSFLLDDADCKDLAEAQAADTLNSNSAMRSEMVSVIEGTPLLIAQMTALALQRNSGVKGEDVEINNAAEANLAHVNGYITDDTSDSTAYLQEVCTAAEAAVLRRATLRSAARSTDGEIVPPLTVYFSAPALPFSSSKAQEVGGNLAATRRSSSRSCGGDASVVYSAGCDERGDVFCTCPRSRFFVPRVNEDRQASGIDVQTARPQADGTTTTPHFERQHQQQLTSSQVPFPSTTPVSQPTAGNMNSRNDTALAAGRPAPPVLSQSVAQRSFPSALDVPDTPSQMHAVSELQDRTTDSGLMNTPDVHLPPRRGPAKITTLTAASTVADVPTEDLNSLVNSAPFCPSISSVGDTLISSPSFHPPPSGASNSVELAGGAQSAARSLQQQQQQQLPPTQQLKLQDPQQLQHGSFVSKTGISFGSLFMEKATPREGKGTAEDHNAAFADKKTRSAESGGGNVTDAAASAIVEKAECTAKGGEEDGGNGERGKDSLNNSTARCGKHRCKARQSRTFVLSYDHPAGHLLCRAFSVLVRPMPDPFGRGARAALEADLLTALQRVCARAATYPDDDDGTNEDDGRRSPRAAVVVDAVTYIPPDLRHTENTAESHWMRFEVTTNERKARMAQRLQEVLNVSWAAQCVCFAHLLQWLRAHVVGVLGESERGGVAAATAATTNTKTARTMAEWDPVQVLERAARVSQDTRERLDALYAGSAVAAVHAHRLDSVEEDFLVSADTVDVREVISLAQLHPQLWKEVGLVAENGDVGAVISREVGESSGGAPREKRAAAAVTFSRWNHSKHASPTSKDEDEKDKYDDEKDHDEAGEEIALAISTFEDTSRRSPMQAEEEHADVGGKKRGRGVPVVDLYDDAISSKEAHRQLEDSKSGAEKFTKAEEGGEDDAFAVLASSVHSPQLVKAPFTLVAAAGLVDAPSDGGGEAVVISTSLAPGGTAALTQNAPPAGNRSLVTLHTKIFRNFDELSDRDDNDDDERGTMSVETPEKHMRSRLRQRQGEAHSFSTPPAAGPQSPHPQNEDIHEVKTHLLPQSPIRASSPPPGKEGVKQEEEDDAVLTDQLMGPLSLTDRPLSRNVASVVLDGEPDRQGVRWEETVHGVVDVPVPVTTRSRSQPQVSACNNESTREGKEEEALQALGGRSSRNTSESRWRDSTYSDSPSSPGSRHCERFAQDGPAPSPSPPAADENNDNSGKAEKEQKADVTDDIVVPPPIRVLRRPSELEGRVKIFTLSYTHQEGTAVCRAWRLLHSALSGEAATDACSPTSPTFAALARDARDCLCDDFLALLQPPDEDKKHAVLSVTLHGDSGAATAMLQVQVQTNERRGTLANRLQDSNHGVRRSSAGSGRGGIVPLTVDEVDHFYFPRLTKLLRKNKLRADTAAQVEQFLESRPAVQGRLIKSYGSIGSLVHYYHGSATALEHELGVSSWKELAGNVTVAPAEADTRGAAPGVTLPLETSSPTIANDRVMPQEDGVDRDNEKREDNSVNNKNNNSRGCGSNVRGGRAGSGDRDDCAAGDDGEDGAPRAAVVSEVKIAGSNNSIKLNPAPSSMLKGRPPPHPRRAPTPPNPITHTDSISFDEVTEEPTSEAGPIVVLRGSTPSASTRSPSTSSTRKPQYDPAGYRNTCVSASATGEPRFAESHERDCHHDSADSDSGVLSPMTSASTSPSMARLPGVSPPPHMQPLEGGQVVSTIRDNENSSTIASNKDDRIPREERVTPTPSTQITQQNPRGFGGTEAPELPPCMFPEAERTPPIQKQQQQQDQRGWDPGTMSAANLSYQVSGSSSTLGIKSEYERVLEGKYKRLMRVAYDGVARGSVPLEPQHQQKTVIGRGKWGTQKVELSLEWEILFVLTFEKSRALGRSSRRAQMVVHPVGFGFECMSGDEMSHQVNETSSLHSSMVNAMTAESSSVHHPPGTTASQISKGSRPKKDSAKSAASHLIIMIQRPFSPNEVGSSSSEIEKTLMAGALLTVSSSKSLSKAARLLGGGGSSAPDDVSNTSRGSAGTNQVAQDMVYQLCQSSLTLDIEMKSSKHVQEALRLLKNSIRRATQAVKKSMSNARIPPPPQ